VCQRHSRPMKDLGFFSAFIRKAQVSQPKVSSEDELFLFSMIFSFG
jgi:hypothetical protein